MAGERRRLQPRDLLALRLVGDVHLAPDGERVAYTETAVNADRNEYTSRIWQVAPGRGPGARTAGPKDSSPRWSPDGRYLAFVRKGDEGSPQIWLLPTAGGEARQLTRVRGGCTGPVWSPDGRTLAFVAKVRPGPLAADGRDEEEKDPFLRFNKDVKVVTRLWYRLDNAGFFDERRTQIGLIAVADPDAPPRYPNGNGGATAGPAAAAPPVALTSGDFDHHDPAFSPDGSLVAFSAHRSPEADWEVGVRDIWVVPAAGGEPRRLTGGDLGAVGPAFSPDGRQLAFTASLPGEQGYSNDNLYLVDLAGGARRCLTAAHDRPLHDCSSKDTPAPVSNPLTWAPDGSALYSLTSDAGRVYVCRIDAASGAVSPVTRGDRCVYSYHIRGESIAFAVAHDLDPGQVWRAAFDGHTAAAEQRLTAVHPWLHDEVALAVPERFVCRGPERLGSSEAGPPLDGWIMCPAGFDPVQRYPAILQIHGGPMSMYGARFFFEFQELCARGYVVFYINPRGSLGYGADFCRCIRAEWGDRDYADCMAAVDHVLATWNCVDGQRLGCMGGSYGGFMVNWIIGHTDRFACAVTMRSVVNRMSAMGTSDLGYHRVEQFGGVYWWDDPTPYLNQSPLLHASRINTPLLIEHQEGDLRCPIDQGEQLYAALKLQKKAVKFVRYPGEYHEMSRSGKPWHRVHRMATNAEWMDAHLRPEGPQR